MGVLLKAASEAQYERFRFVVERLRAGLGADGEEIDALDPDTLSEMRAARADKLALILAEQAAAAVLQGQVEEARQMFAKAHEGTTNLHVLYLAYEFYHRTGELKAAEDMLERWLAISGREAETSDTAAAYGNLGIIYETRGELDQAEEMYRKVLAIDEKLGRQEGVASAYGNLGIIFWTRGELDRAEEMHKKSLAINEKLGRQEGVACVYGNLGIVYQMRGELDRAEEMHKNALGLHEKLGYQERIAITYGNLWGIAKDRGDQMFAKAYEGTTNLHVLYLAYEFYHRTGELKAAEDMLERWLAISGREAETGDTAAAYGNLGNIYQTRGELDQAEEMYRKVLAIDEKLGRREGMGSIYGNLGLIFRTRGELDRAEEMHKKSLAINEKLAPG